MNRITGEAIEVPVIKYYRIEAILYSYSFQQLNPPPVWFRYAVKWKSRIARLLIVALTLLLASYCYENVYCEFSDVDSPS